DELRGLGVPCEVVGLGGLLLEPEVVEIVSTLRALADPMAGNAVVRLLAGPRWRLGPRDLDALGRRARRLAVRRHPGPGDPVAVDAAARAPEASRSGGREATRSQEYDEVDEHSLVDALDDPGEARHYSADGYRRIARLRDELRLLRERSGAPLPELVMTVAATMCLDVELASRPDVRPADALRNIDRLVEVAEEFVAAGEDPGLLAFLGYLDTAEERERGLELDRADDAEPDAERVQLMTVHAAKGLEWDAVFVAGMTVSVFPVEGQAVSNWTRQIAALPFPLRGDRAELPELAWAAFSDQVEARDALDRFARACKERSLLEEQRLAYVAVTRARDVLVCSGYWWDTSAKARRGPSTLLQAVHDVCMKGFGTIPVWEPEPDDDVVNPVLDVPVERPWPFDPLGERRGAVSAAAALVAAAAADVTSGGERDPDELGDAGAADALFDDAGQVPASLDPAVAAWREEADILLGELARLRDRRAPVVELPPSLSVSQLVELRRDPTALARQLRRPMPHPPARTARRGTRFHLWLEAGWGQQRLIDVDELPGAADESPAPDADLLALQEAFRRSEWWSRVPAEVEFPFDLVLDGMLLRGRCDAVFTDSSDGLVDVIDWKTGRPMTGEDATAAAVQLAVYRLAWHHLTSTPLERIRAAFHYVAAERTVRPADLLGHDELVELVRSIPVAE
ncbi:MAG: ATP-dependent helicase UvrD/PcrA, partial [Actinomycetota bacterium]|nr:ATP-dependent helicase UvrD/PcrA [Actinomycetota bacterium]